MKLSREQFVKLIESAINEASDYEGGLTDDERAALMKVANESPACAVGNYGPKYEEWPSPDEPLLDCMCPVQQARLVNTRPPVSEFAAAFDTLALNTYSEAFGLNENYKIEVVE